MGVGYVSWEHFQLSNHMQGKGLAATTWKGRDSWHTKTRCTLCKVRFLKNDSVSSLACFGQTPLPIKSAHFQLVWKKGVVIYSVAHHANTVQSTRSNAGFPLCTEEFRQNKAGMSRVMDFWTLLINLHETKASQRPAVHNVVDLETECYHGDDLQQDPQSWCWQGQETQGTLPEREEETESEFTTSW